MNSQNPLKTRNETLFDAMSLRKPFAKNRRRARSGFMTLGLILCLILILTVAAVLWSYQYLTIQNLELECAARSALHAAKNVTTATIVNNAIVSDSKLQKVLNANTAQQSRNKNITVSISGTPTDTTAVLAFSQPRVLGVFRNVFSTEKIQDVEGTSAEPKSFTQYYSVTFDTNGVITGYTKTYQ